METTSARAQNIGAQPTAVTKCPGSFAWRLRTLIQDLGWEYSIFGGATLVALVHAVDDALLNRQSGVGADQHALAAGLGLFVGLVSIALFPRVHAWIRADLALTFGVLALVNGALHVMHISGDEVSGSDLTGVVCALAGALLITLGLVIPFRRRAAGASSNRRKWAYRAGGFLIGVVALVFIVLPMSIATTVTHKFREPIGSPPSASYQPVTFSASDGLRLFGWYVPSTNGATVIVVHGGGGDRMGALEHAELLVRHGYGVLVYDSRGRGESEGSPNAFGWEWDKDVSGALAFLSEHPEVDMNRIGGLGLSTGADVLIEVAAHERELRAVVSDGATGRSFADARNIYGLDPTLPFAWSMYMSTRVLSGSSPGEPLKDLVRKVSPTPLLLIAAGKGVDGEREANLAYAEAANQPFEFWDLPHVNHTSAIREQAPEYETRVIKFLDAALLGGN